MQAWPTLLQSCVRKMTLLNKVQPSMMVEPTMLRSTIACNSLRLKPHIILRTLFTHDLGPLVGASVVLLRVLVILGISGNGEDTAGRSCHTKIPVRIRLMNVSTVIMAIALSCLGPIRQRPSWAEISAMGSVYCQLAIAINPHVVKSTPMTYMGSRRRSRNEARTM